MFHTFCWENYSNWSWLVIKILYEIWSFQSGNVYVVIFWVATQSDPWGIKIWPWVLQTQNQEWSCWWRPTAIYLNDWPKTNNHQTESSSQIPPLIKEEAPFQNMCHTMNKNLAIGPDRTWNKNDCAGEVQQKFPQPTDQLTRPELSTMKYQGQFPLVEVVTKEWLNENNADREDLKCVVVNCRLWRKCCDYL
jgi:hypothetical protein